MKMSFRPYCKTWVKCSVLVLFFFCHGLVQGQRKGAEFSPRKASIYSAILPGAGQVYNKKYWKVPLVAAALGTSAYLIKFNTEKHDSFKKALIARQDNDPNTVDTKYEGLNDAQVQSSIDFYQRNRDLSYFALALSYILNIVDASVDAHLKGFDVQDDINISFTPMAYPGLSSPGLSLCYHF